MHAGKVFTDDSESEELGARKYGNDRGKEGEAWNAGSLEEVASEDEDKDHDSEEGEGEPYKTRDLQRDHAKPSHHVQGVDDQSPHRVIRLSVLAYIVADRNRDKAVRPPGQENVDRDEGARVLREGGPHPCTKGPKSADLACGLGSHTSA